MGSYITYLRRYSIAALCGIVASDEDDDGQLAMPQDREQFAKAAINRSNTAKDSK
jgi:hypothetical protein